MLNHSSQRKAGFRLALFSTAVALVVIMLGAFTRLADAGLGCPDWPGCYGHLSWPKTVAEVDRANMLFPETPVDHAKTWPEMVHRYFASSLGLLTICLLGVAVVQRRKGVQDQPLRLPLFLLAFIILQGMFGMWTVTLKLWPQVVTAHLLGGFTTLSLLWLLSLRLNNQSWQMPAQLFSLVRKFRPFALLGLLIVITQVFLGGWTTSNYAAVACPDLPMCHGAWLPDMDFASGFNFFQHIGPNYLGGQLDNEARIAIHFSHRMGAIVTALYLIGLVVYLWASIATPEARRMAAILLVILCVQLALGLGNIYFHFPLSVAVAHNAVGALLLLTLVTLNYYVFTVKLFSR